MMEAFVIGVGASSVSAALGALGYRLYGWATTVAPTKRLWGINDPNRLVICVSADLAADGPRFRPGTGVGQMLAVSPVLLSLNRAYRHVSGRSVFLSSDEILARLEDDLVLLGGPEHNRITRLMLEKLRADGACPVYQADNVITWTEDGDTSNYKTDCEEGRAVCDYAMLLRMRNPMASRARTLVILSGCHTWGTVAAARYFTERVRGDLRLRGGKYRGNFAAIVKALIAEDYAYDLTEVHYCEW